MPARPEKPISRLIQQIWRREDWPRWVDALILVILAAVVFVVFRYRPFGSRDAASHPAVGSALAAVDLQPLDAQWAAREVEDLRGRVTLIVFWGPWCKPSVDTLADLSRRLQDLRSNEDFQLWAVTCRPLGSAIGDAGAGDTLAEQSQQVLRTAGIDVPCYRDSGHVTRAALAAASGRSAAEDRLIVHPTCVLLGRDGRIVAVWVGTITGQSEQIEQAVRARVEHATRQ